MAVVVLVAIVIFCSVCCQTAWAFAAVKRRDEKQALRSLVVVVVVLVAVLILSVCCQHGMCICSGAASGREALRSLVLRRLVVVVVVLMAIVIFLFSVLPNGMGICSGEVSG